MTPTDALSGDLQYGAEVLQADGTTLWFAGKQMLPDKKLSEYLGRHEKTKAVVKLQKKGQGAPAREPVSGRLLSIMTYSALVCSCNCATTSTFGP